MAVSSDNRVFVNFPRWSDSVPVAVAELTGDRVLTPYPDTAWNNYTAEKPPESVFVCVQATYAGANNRLWVLDPANPRFGGIVPGGPKLVEIDLATDSVVRVITLDSNIAPTNSYLNDVRIDTKRNFAYISESGMGAIIVIDLATNQARRLLDDHPSTRAESTAVVIEGSRWLRPDGSMPQVHADGIALDLPGGWLYWQALTGRQLYRIPTWVIVSDSLPESRMPDYIETVAGSGIADGILFVDGWIYLTSLEFNAVRRVRPGTDPVMVVQSDSLAWPDTFAESPDGHIYVTTAQIHRGPNPPEPYRLLKFRIPEVEDEGNKNR